MSQELTPQEWAELAHLVNVACHLQPNLEPLRAKVRQIAVDAQAHQAAAAVYVLPSAEPKSLLRRAVIRNGGVKNA